MYLLCLIRDILPGDMEISDAVEEGEISEASEVNTHEGVLLGKDIELDPYGQMLKHKSPSYSSNSANYIGTNQGVIDKIFTSQNDNYGKNRLADGFKLDGRLQRNLPLDHHVPWINHSRGSGKIYSNII